MYKFSRSSKKQYNTIHPLLQDILKEAIKYIDFTIICGHRNKENQNKAYKEHASTKQWPDSKHNQNPSIAVDIAPYPIDWENRDRFIFLAGIIYHIAQQQHTKIRFGGNWSTSWQFEEQKDILDDLVHFELVE